MMWLYLSKARADGKPKTPSPAHGVVLARGFWLISWTRSAPRIEIQEIYQKLGDLVADQSLSAASSISIPIDQFKEASISHSVW
jgi:hypothetical protein